TVAFGADLGVCAWLMMAHAGNSGTAAQTNLLGPDDGGFKAESPKHDERGLGIYHDILKQAAELRLVASEMGDERVNARRWKARRSRRWLALLSSRRHVY